MDGTPLVAVADDMIRWMAASDPIRPTAVGSTCGCRSAARSGRTPESRKAVVRAICFWLLASAAWFATLEGLPAPPTKGRKTALTCSESGVAYLPALFCCRSVKVIEKFGMDEP